jgi:hypothetical protein
MKRSVFFVRLVLCLVIAGIVVACAGTVPRPATTDAAPSLTWPAPPAAERIRFVQAFSRPEEIGIKPGIFSRLVALVAGAEEHRLVRPMCVATAPDGTLFVGDPGARGVHRFRLSANRYDLLLAEGGQPLPSPVGLAVDASGTVYVVDSELRRLYTATAAAKALKPLTLAVELDQPTAVAIDMARNRISVVDTKAHAVKVFGLDGRLLFTVGRRGAGDGEFNYPVSVWFGADGGFLVADSLNFRIQRFDAEGRFLSRFGSLGDAEGDFSRPKGVALDSHGHIYVVEGLFGVVQIFSASGEYLLSFGGLGESAGSFWLPTGIFVDGGDAIYVADSRNGRVQVFRYTGGTS